VEEGEGATEVGFLAELNTAALTLTAPISVENVNVNVSDSLPLRSVSVSYYGTEVGTNASLKTLPLKAVPSMIGCYVVFIIINSSSNHSFSSPTTNITADDTTCCLVVEGEEELIWKRSC